MKYASWRSCRPQQPYTVLVAASAAERSAPRSELCRILGQRYSATEVSSKNPPCAFIKGLLLIGTWDILKGSWGGLLDDK